MTNPSSRDDRTLAFYRAEAPVYTASGELIDNGVTGFIVDPHDPGELGAKLLLLAANPSLALAMGENARAQATSYTWADVAHRYLQALDLQTSVSGTSYRALTPRTTGRQIFCANA